MRSSLSIPFAGAVSMTLLALSGAGAQSSPDPIGTIYDGPVPLDLYGSNFSYPWPVKQFKFYNQHQNLSMAFMDVPSADHSYHKNKTALLLHGAYFCSVTWSDTAGNLSAAGYRVILPDHIGFCKSSKPQGYSYSVDQQAMNLNGLLTALGLSKVTLIAHSMGGMIGSRYSLMYPDKVDQLILVDPLGLEDWVAKGVPFQPIDATYETQAAQTFATIKAYEQSSYFYNATWEPAYDVWVQMLANIISSDYGAAFAYAYGLAIDALLGQPVIYQFPLLRTRTYLMVGQEDMTALGKAWSSAAVVATLGHYDILGPAAAAMIPNCTFHMFPGLGHAPYLQDPPAFHKVLFSWLD